MGGRSFRPPVRRRRGVAGSSRRTPSPSRVPAPGCPRNRSSCRDRHASRRSRGRYCNERRRAGALSIGSPATSGNGRAILRSVMMNEASRHTESRRSIVPYNRRMGRRLPLSASRSQSPAVAVMPGRRSAGVRCAHAIRIGCRGLKKRLSKWLERIRGNRAARWPWARAAGATRGAALPRLHTGWTVHHDVALRHRSRPIRAARTPPATPAAARSRSALRDRTIRARAARASSSSSDMREGAIGLPRRAHAPTSGPSPRTTKAVSPAPSACASTRRRALPPTSSTGRSSTPSGATGAGCVNSPASRWTRHSSPSRCSRASSIRCISSRDGFATSISS